MLIKKQKLVVMSKTGIEATAKGQYRTALVRFMKICGVILAAGCSSRAGEFKMTCKIKDKPMIEHIIETMDGLCDSIIVVTGSQREKLYYLMGKYDKVRLVYNENYHDGMFSSVLTGLKYFNDDAVFICPGDYPAIGLNTYQKLSEKDYGVQVPGYEGIPGHPVYIRKDFVEKLNNGSFSTLKEFINSCDYHMVQVDDPAILMDVDYPDDFLHIESYLQEHKR